MVYGIKVEEEALGLAAKIKIRPGAKNTRKEIGSMKKISTDFNPY